MPRADLLLRGGRVIDPGTGVDADVDIATAAGVITAIGPDLPPADAVEVVDCHGRTVTPGLVDLHSHVYWGATTLGGWPDEICLGSGVTTTADGGSAGSDTFGAFHRWIVGGSTTRVLAFVNLSRIGLAGILSAGELVNPAYADRESISTVFRAHPQTAVGVKFRASAEVTGGTCLPLLRTALRVASDAGVPVMIHIGATADPADQILALLRPGDIVTHFQTPKENGLLDHAGNVLAAARDARARGVLFDCGHGKTHFSLAVARRLLDQDFPPDIISSDISATTFAALRPGLATVLNKWLALGLPLRDVLRAATVTPAAAIRRASEFGQLAVGQCADIAVFDSAEGSVTYTDAVGATVTGQRRLVPWLTVRAGEVAWADEPAVGRRRRTRLLVADHDAP